MSLSVSFSKEQFELLKTEPEFAEILCLARVANSLRYSLMSGLPLSNIDEIIANRQRTNSFFITLGILNEGFQMLDTIGKNFREYEAFKLNISLLKKSEKYKKLYNPVIHNARNFISFHFNTKVIADILDKSEINDFLFASANDDKSGNLHYSLADFLAVKFITNNYIGEDKIEHIFEDVVNDVVLLSGEFITAIDELIAEYIVNLNNRFNNSLIIANSL